ncbi:MAG: alpha-amylase [Anaerolineae bacterium]|nr:alpha-amylase [Anaerolineae bacterium]
MTTRFAIHRCRPARARSRPGGRAIALLTTLLVLANCNPTLPPAAPTDTPVPPPSGESGWWNDAVFYQVFVRSFYDSDGDGIGDLPGLIEKLDYLNDGDPTTSDDLGVSGIWLMPIAQSPSYHGYDVTDYMTVEQDYGTNEDFRALIDAAHARGIRVIVDLVLNHTSAAHPWFVNATVGPDATYRDWYVWSEENPGYNGPWDQRVWHRRGDDFYYGLFWDQMPDLNYRNPQVTAAMHDVAHFWLVDMGADGFRLDAARHLVEEGQQQENTAATHAWLADFDRFTDDVGPDVLTVGEVWDDTSQAASYVVDDELDLVFEFDLASAIVDGVDNGIPDWLAYVVTQAQSAYPQGQYATFLTNHDQERVMSELGGDVDQARLAATLLLTLPGVPFIYYGEEIGMSGQKPDPSIRTPMQWSDDAHAGFTTRRPWNPVNEDYATINVAAESADPHSLLSHYRRLIHLRSDHVALRWGELIPLESSCNRVYAFLRHHETETLLVVANFGAERERNCTLSLFAGPLSPGEYHALDLLTDTRAGDLSVGQDGAFSYIPRGNLPPRQGIVLLLERRE